MARARKSAKLLSLAGAFEHNPYRTREDLPGAGPADLKPPEHLPADCVPAWRYIVERLPRTALSKSEEITIESAARIYTRFRNADDSTEEFRRLAQLLLAHLGALGMTLAARAKLGSPGAEERAKNKFGQIKKAAG